VEERTYRNVFREIGISQKEIDDRREELFQKLFYGKPGERLYHEVGMDMAYFEDTGNHDARTEGMSYAMMMCVQMNRESEFDRLWKWARTYMYLDHGPNAGYFAWSCGVDGSKNAEGAAPDGEEYFAMALFFAAHRWGNKEAPFDYENQARTLLHTCIHKGEDGAGGRAMWDPENHLIRFITDVDFSDPSYHLPHFYELFAKWAQEDDRNFWKEAAQASRQYWKQACHPVTGLCPEYAHFDGTPVHPGREWPDQTRHDWYYSDAYRTIANIGLDAAWFGCSTWAMEEADRLQRFFCETVRRNDRAVYETDGTVLPVQAMHPIAIVATNAQASLAAAGPYAQECVRRFWNTPLRGGERRYYDNCLYFFAFLSLGGDYRIY
jgi:oligosaccharide reducing-end xylanase